MRKALGLAAVVAVVAVPSAGAVGPWPGTVSSVTSASTGARYSVTDDGTATTLTAGARSARLPGVWGIPAVTSTQLPGGLSVDGKLLVLAQQPSYEGLRSASKFLVVSTRTLAVTRTVTLRGEFGFDAVSADDRTLYVIEHRDQNDLNAYIVRAYDLRTGVLLAKPVVAADEGTTMRGYPVARATTSTGAWVYTLYWRSNGTTFVHALATIQRRAVCLDLAWTSQQVWNASLRLSRDGKQLFVRSSAGKLVETVSTPA